MTREPMTHLTRSLVIGMTALVATPLAMAADSIWLNVGTDFNTADNWSAGVPGAGNQAIFDVAASVQPNLSESLSIGQLHFSTAAASGYTLSASEGQSLTLTSNTAILSTNTSGTNTVDVPLILTSGTKTFTQAPGGELIVSGDISESSGAVTLTIFRTAAGGHTITLSGDNSYSGGTNLSGAGGTLNIGSATAIGTGTLTLVTSTHTVDNTSGTDLTLANGLRLDGVGFIFAGSSSMKMTGAVQLSGSQTAARTITVHNNTLHLTGAITEGTLALGLTKQGAGTLILDGPASYSNPTTVGAGTLIINGDFSAATGAVSVNNGGTLGGTGIIGGAATVNSGGKLAPGTSPGTLTFNSDLTLANNSSLIFDAGDLVDVKGMLTLTDNWHLILEDGFQDGGSMTLFTYGSLAANPDLDPTINIANLGFTPSQTLTLIDTGDSIVLQGVSIIPEPASLILLALGSAAMLARRRGSQAG